MVSVDEQIEVVAHTNRRETQNHVSSVHQIELVTLHYHPNLAMLPNTDLKFQITNRYVSRVQLTANVETHSRSLHYYKHRNYR